MKTHFKLKHDETYEIVEAYSSFRCSRCVFVLDDNCTRAANGEESYCRRGAGSNMRNPIIRIVKVTK